MLSFQKIVAVIFVLITLVSIGSVSYIVYILFGAYDVGHLLSVSISGIDISAPSGSTVSVTTHFLFDNPSRFALELVRVAGFVYLNGQFLTSSNDPNDPTILSVNRFQLPAFSERNQVSIVAGNIPSSKVSSQSPRVWFIKLHFTVQNVPLIGVGYFTAYLEYPRSL